MTLAALALFAALGFADSKTLAVQIQLDRAGFSCSTIDGQWGAKSERALRLYEYTRANARKPALAATPEQAYDRYFANGRHSRARKDSRRSRRARETAADGL